MLTAPYSLCLPGLPTNGKPIFCLVLIFLWFLVCVSLSDFLCVFFAPFSCPISGPFTCLISGLIFFFRLISCSISFPISCSISWPISRPIWCPISCPTFCSFSCLISFPFLCPISCPTYCPIWCLISFPISCPLYGCFFFLPISSSCPIFLQAAQTLWEFVDFQFVRECMKINKIRLKFHFLTKIEIKMTYLVFFFLCFTVSSPLELFGSRFIDV